jgi:tetratricopeptide (TPR) repeat protein
MVSPSWLHSSVAAIGFLLAVTAVVGFVVLRRRVPAAAFGIALFVLPLATVMNVFFTLRVWIAERYLFLPTIGYSLLIIAFASRWVETHTEESRRGRQYVALVALLALVVANSVLAIDRVGVWQSPVHLWSDAVRKDAGFSGSGPITADEIGDRAVNEKLLALVAAAYRRQGNIEEAVRLLARVSDAEGIELTLANAAFERSDFDEAVQLAHRVAVRGDWSAPQAWELCGRARKMQNQIDKARICFTRAITAFEKNHRSPLKRRSSGLNAHVKTRRRTIPGLFFSWQKRATLPVRLPRRGNSARRSLERKGGFPNRSHSILESRMSFVPWSPRSSARTRRPSIYSTRG